MQFIVSPRLCCIFGSQWTVACRTTVNQVPNMIAFLVLFSLPRESSGTSDLEFHQPWTEYRGRVPRVPASRCDMFAREILLEIAIQHGTWTNKANRQTRKQKQAIKSPTRSSNPPTDTQIVPTFPQTCQPTNPPTSPPINQPTIQSPNAPREYQKNRPSFSARPQNVVRTIHTGLAKLGAHMLTDAAGT